MSKNTVTVLIYHRHKLLDLIYNKNSCYKTILSDDVSSSAEVSSFSTYTQRNCRH
jgi:hypothetical protein